MKDEHTAGQELVNVTVPAVLGIVVCDPDFESHSHRVWPTNVASIAPDQTVLLSMNFRADPAGNKPLITINRFAGTAEFPTSSVQFTRL